MVCEQFSPIKGRDGQNHPVCRLDVLEGEFGSHETECPSKGDPKGCKYDSPPIESVRKDENVPT